MIQEAAADAATEADPDLVVDGEPETGTADGDGATVVKRKTRRGSRGGKNRRKKPAVVGATDDVEVDAEDIEADAEEDDSVVELDTASVVGAADEQAVGDGPAAGAAEAAERDDQDDEGYVPMSEWLGDFDRR